MAYATQDDLERYVDATELKKLTDDDRDGAADAGLIDGLLEDASQRVDGALAAAGYTVPVAGAGEDLRSLVARLTVGAIYARRRVSGVMPEAIRELVSQAHRELLAIGKGDLAVVGAVRAADTPASPAGIAYSTEDDRNWSPDLF